MLSSQQIQLTAMTVGMAESVLAGVPDAGDSWAPDYPLADELDAIRAFLGSRKSGSESGDVFGLYVIRDLNDNSAIGGIGFFGPPDENGAVEIGYGVVPSRRRRGVATLAILSILDIANKNGARFVRADTSTDNLASMAVMLRAGMEEVRRSPSLVFFEIKLRGTSPSVPETPAGTLSK